MRKEVTVSDKHKNGHSPRGNDAVNTENIPIIATQDSPAPPHSDVATSKHFDRANMASGEQGRSNPTSETGTLTGLPVPSLFNDDPLDDNSLDDDSLDDDALDDAPLDDEWKTNEMPAEARNAAVRESIGAMLTPEVEQHLKEFFQIGQEKTNVTSPPAPPRTLLTNEMVEAFNYGIMLGEQSKNATNPSSVEKPTDVKSAPEEDYSNNKNVATHDELALHQQENADSDTPPHDEPARESTPDPYFGTLDIATVPVDDATSQSLKTLLSHDEETAENAILDTEEKTTTSLSKELMEQALQIAESEHRHGDENAAEPAPGPVPSQIAKPEKINGTPVATEKKSINARQIPFETERENESSASKAVPHGVAEAEEITDTSESCITAKSANEPADEANLQDTTSHGDETTSDDPNQDNAFGNRPTVPSRRANEAGPLAPTTMAIDAREPSPTRPTTNSTPQEKKPIQIMVGIALAAAAVAVIGVMVFRTPDKAPVAANDPGNQRNDDVASSSSALTVKKVSSRRPVAVAPTPSRPATTISQTETVPEADLPSPEATTIPSGVTASAAIIANDNMAETREKEFTPVPFPEPFSTLSTVSTPPPGDDSKTVAMPTGESPSESTAFLSPEPTSPDARPVRGNAAVPMVVTDSPAIASMSESLQKDSGARDSKEKNAMTDTMARSSPPALTPAERRPVITPNDAVVFTARFNTGTAVFRFLDKADQKAFVQAVRSRSNGKHIMVRGFVTQEEKANHMGKIAISRAWAVQKFLQRRGFDPKAIESERGSLKDVASLPTERNAVVQVIFYEPESEKE